jgi:hypothetical protein
MALESIRYNHGRHGELEKLNSVRNDPTKPAFIRKRADEGIAKIEAQLKDKKLQGLREQLIKAARAGDFVAQAKIQQQMRAHTGEDRETGLYEQD